MLVWALDRLTREGITAILGLVDKLHNYGVKVISYQESWTEVPNEFTPLFYAIIGFIAQFESKRRSERTKAGIERYRRQKGKWGRPRKNVNV